MIVLFLYSLLIWHYYETNALTAIVAASKTMNVICCWYFGLFLFLCVCTISYLVMKNNWDMLGKNIIYLPMILFTIFIEMLAFGAMSINIDLMIILHIVLIMSACVRTAINSSYRHK